MNQPVTADCILQSPNGKLISLLFYPNADVKSINTSLKHYSTDEIMIYRRSVALNCVYFLLSEYSTTLSIMNAVSIITSQILNY